MDVDPMGNVIRAGGGELDWLLDELIDRVAGAERMVLLSADGLLMGRSRSLGQDDGDQLAAISAGFQSLARGAGRHFGGGRVRQTIVEMDNSFLIITAAGRGACLALLASVDADLGMLAYEMNLLVKRVGRFLSAAPREAAGQPSRGHLAG